ncbi:hypothetical protein PG991_003581 [Apiospora marii]|uniref:Uncharacterized protein n=1 Tax=Apiospora marii TaxID=335849 RepID=A0ABR1S3S0_9PEZI
MSLAMSINAAPATNTTTTDTSAHTPTPRLPSEPLHSPDPRGPICNFPNGPSHALQPLVRLNIAALYRRGDAPCTASPGPGKCTRVACDLGSAIWLCNDRDAETSAPCRVVGDYATIILDRCGFYDQARDEELVEGRLYDTSGPYGDVGPGWGNVVVGYDLGC